MAGLRQSPSRRAFLTGLATLGAKKLLGGFPALAQVPLATRRVIDVHHHIIPPKVLAAHREEFVRGGAAGGNVLQWTPQVSLDEMDMAGVATSVLSMSTPGSWYGSVEDGRKMSREINEFCATMGRDHPGRFGLFAALPLPDTEGSLKEIEYAFGTLKADGIGLMTSYDNLPLGDKSFAPVFEELNRRRTIVFIHRTAGTCCIPLRGLAGNQEFIVDDLRMLNSLLTSGALVKYPNIKWIHAHGDKIFPWVAKLNGAPLNGADRAGKPAWAPNGVQAQLRTMYVDSAGNNKMTMDELRLLGILASHTMFGTDVPYGTVQNNLTNLRNSMGLSQAELAAVEYQTAWTLLPKFKQA